MNYPVRSKRFVVNIQLDQSSHDLFYSSQIMNISKGGVFIKADLVLPVGSVIDFTFTLPKSQKKIETTGVVVWSRRALSKHEQSFPKHPSGMGIQFIHLDIEQVNWIIEEVAQSA